MSGDQPRCACGFTDGMSSEQHTPERCRCWGPRKDSDPLARPVDRALDRDHRLCSLDPCSDCR